jgi:hypothetical protein
MLYKDGRIAGVQSTLDTNLYNTPWNVTSFPTIPNTSAPYLSPQPTAAPVCANALKQALAANTTLQTMVNITGSGYLDFALMHASVGVTSTFRIVITVDGVAVLDKTTVSASGTYKTLMVVGELTGSDSQYLAGGLPIYFRQSLLVQVQDSTGTAGASCMTRYVLATPYAA